MPFEVTCGQCHGALLVEHAGVVVACPTCGAHLDIPADADLVAVDAEATESTPMASESAPSGVLPPSANDDVLQEPTASPSELGPIVSHSSPQLNDLAALPASFSSVGETEFAADAPAAEVSVDDSGTTDPAMPVAPAWGNAATVDPEQTLIAEGSVPSLAPTEPATVVLNEPVTMAMADADVSTVPAHPELQPTMREPLSYSEPIAAENTVQIDIPPPPPREVVSKQLFFYVASYASALTLAMIYLLYSVFTYRDHVLESLPDIEPPMKEGQIGMKAAKPQDDVAPGHVLRLGESQRFGNVRITPVKITRGPVTFQHLFGDRNMAREPSVPVYKLWLKFENVSPDQVFTPLSTPIVYKRVTSGLGSYKTNNFLVAEAERMKKNGDIYYLFGLPESSEFAIAGQNLNTPLGPGEKLETFLPAEDSLNEITGEWTWRVFFRKGYNPRSHRGVTTVIDVRFDGSAITTDGDAHQPS